MIDTAKAANLFTVYKDAELMDFVNAPIGKGLHTYVGNSVDKLSVYRTSYQTSSPTSHCCSYNRRNRSGTLNWRCIHPLTYLVDAGSETTGTAILDITSRSFKTGISNRALKPVLGIVVSPLHLHTFF